jgi:hypothetical protein
VFLCIESDWILKLKFLSQNYGIYIIAIWSAVLGLLNVIRLVYTLQLGPINIGANLPLAQLYLYQWVSVAFSVVFGVTAVGLWRRLNWARILFLIAALLFFVVSIIGLFNTSADAPPLEAKWVLGGRYFLSIVLPFVYLNLPFVRKAFQNHGEDNADDG